MMDRNSKDLTLRIAQLKKAIRQKYRQFKQGVVDTEVQLEKQYKPIISELRKQSTIETKIEPKEEEEYSFTPHVASSPKPKPHVSTIVEEEFFGDDDDEMPTVSEVLRSRPQEASQWINDKFTNSLTKKYMHKFMKDEAGSKNKIDNIYGPRMEGDKLMVGDRLLQFEEDGSIRIDQVSYKATEGLYELLFKRAPNSDVYTDHDLTVYKDILLKTNAHKKGYTRSGHINRPANSIKYKAVIADLFPKQMYTAGKGLVNKVVSSRDIQYWDDPNELCNRLNLLVSSTEAGNTSHKNEILNIVSELREAGIIKGVGNSRFKSLVL